MLRIERGDPALRGGTLWLLPSELEDWADGEVWQFTNNTMEHVFDPYDEYGSWFWVFDRDYPRSEVERDIEQSLPDLPPIYEGYVQATPFTDNLILKAIRYGLESLRLSGAYSCCSAYVYVETPDGSRSWKFRLSNHKAMTARSHSDAEVVVDEDQTYRYFHEESGDLTAKGERALKNLIYSFFELSS